MWAFKMKNISVGFSMSICPIHDTHVSSFQPKICGGIWSGAQQRNEPTIPPSHGTEYDDVNDGEDYYFIYL